MRHRRGLEYLSTIILKFLLILSATYSKASDPDDGIFKEDIDELLKNWSLFDTERDSFRSALMEKFKTVFKRGNETGFQHGNETGFQHGNETGFQCGFESGYANASEFMGSLAFECAISSIKLLVAKLNNHSEVHKYENGQAIKDLSKHFSETKLAKINMTHDGWIHNCTIEARLKKGYIPYNNESKPQKNGLRSHRNKFKRRQIKQFVFETDYTFGKCLYLLRSENPPIPFVLIKKSLKNYVSKKPDDESNNKQDTLYTRENLDLEFCGSIARCYHLANAINYKYMNIIKSVPQPTEEDRKDFHEALLDILPFWYMTQEDITFLNIYRYSYSLLYGIKYKPIMPYYISNRWTENSELVVIPLLYNSTECGVVSRHKASSPPPNTKLHPLDYEKLPELITKTITRIIDISWQHQ